MSTPKRPAARKPPALTIHAIQLDKESWEAVPNIVNSSVRAIHTSLGSIQKWSAYQENEMKVEIDRREELDKRLETTDIKVEQLQERLKFLFTYTNSLFARQHQESSAISTSLRRELEMTKTFFDSFCNSFGVPAKKPHGPIEAKTAEANAPQEASKGPEKDLEALCTELEGQQEGLNESFKRWKSWREHEAQRSDYLHSTTEELRLTAERTRERLITWRETLKESAHVVDALSGAIVSTQRDVADLKSTQVTRSNVDEVVRGRALELEEVIRQNREKLDDLGNGLINHREEVQQNVDIVQQRMQERIENHGEEVMGALRNNLNPITTYLNSMHVKADEARAELDDVMAQVPMLQKQIEEVTTSLHKSASDSQNQVDDLYGRLQDVTTNLQSHGDLLQRERQVWSDSIKSSSDDVTARVQEVKSAHKSLQETLEAVETKRIASLDNGLTTLEQKVAKWVHSQPLPAKISEARLYALESRLLEETNARVRLEAQVQDLPVVLRSATGAPDGTGVTQSWASLHHNQSGSSLQSVSQHERSNVTLPKLPGPNGTPQPPSQHQHRAFPSPRKSQIGATRKIAPEHHNTPELAAVNHSLPTALAKKSEAGIPVAV